MEMLACDWGGKAGKCWECWKCEPCCGEPCNVGDAIKCLACWYCCGSCSAAKLFAYSVSQDCALLNHCVPILCCGFCAEVCLRHNLRRKAGAGDDGWIGDIIMVCFCGPCTFCQELRSVPPDAWNWVKELKEKGFKVMISPWKFVDK